MNKKNNSIISLVIIILSILIFANIGSSIPAIASGLFSFAKKAIIFSLIGLIVVLVLVVLLLIFAIKGDKKKPTKANTNQDFYTLLTNHTFENNRIIIDETTYLQLTDLDTIIPETIDIYMNNEYVGSLAEFGKAYPNAYNTLQKNLVKQLSKKNKKTKKTNEPIINETQEVVKDCSYFITLFQKLNSEIEVEEVKTQIIETIGYLREIKQIEDEFGESKNKTRKLYEYYLPMYADILANYDRLHDNAPLSQEFKDNEIKLLKTSDLINTALKNVSSSLVENYHTNLNVDMKTLESILKKDGLVNDIEVSKHEQ